MYYSSANYKSDTWPIEQNYELHVPPVPGYGFTDDETQIAWDSEILHSFAELTKTTIMKFIFSEEIKKMADNLDASDSGIILRPPIF